MKNLLLAIPLVALAGCASVSSFFSSPTAAPIIVASVDIAVATAEQKGITAAQINTVAKAALAADTGVNGTLAAVSALVDADVAKLNIPAGDKAAADILIAALSGAVSAKVGTSTSLAAAQADAATVLQAVIAATGG
jgi:uncharacterized protein YceK